MKYDGFLQMTCERFGPFKHIIILLLINIHVFRVYGNSLHLKIFCSGGTSTSTSKGSILCYRSPDNFHLVLYY